MLKPKQHTYDEKCYELAQYFLSAFRTSKEEDIRELAWNIQSICEDACQDIEERTKK